MGDSDDKSDEFKRIERDLIERSKELKTLYAVIDTAEIPGLEFDEIISALKAAIPNGFQYPDHTCIRITVNGNEYASENFKETSWVLSEPIVLHGANSGHLDVFYTKEYPDEDEGPFLKEERTLLNAVAKRVSRMIERLHIDRILRVKNLSFDTSISANAILGMVGTILEPNQAAVELWGYIDLNEVIDKHISDFFADPDKAMTVFNTLQEQGKWEGDFFAKRKDGSIFTAYALANSIVDRKGNVICYQTSVIDISEQRKLQDKLARRLEQSINVISKIGELRDMYTAGHQKRVQELACAIAFEMGMPSETITNISQGALIHDIGKIYVASEILNKPGKLTNLEFEMIKTHVVHGYEIVKEIDFPEQLLTMIYQHHERLDGSGYPNGISGDEIIIESRILAVADVVEAMSSHRPYRPSLGIEPALEELRKWKGIKYDSDVVDICIKLFTDKGFKFSG